MRLRVACSYIRSSSCFVHITGGFPFFTSGPTKSALTIHRFSFFSNENAM